MAHTPGPWEARPTDGQIILNGSNAYDIQEIYNDQGGFNPDDIRLMAAAPELLAALKELVHYDDGSSEQGSYGYEVLGRCRNAIAKAEGRADDQ